MARMPALASRIQHIRGSVYSALAGRLRSYKGEIYPFHVGDTWMEPAVGCRMEDLTVTEHPGLHKYGHVRGEPGLIEAISERTASRTGCPAGAADVLVTAGATGGLGAVCGAIVERGHEVLILAPFWPLIDGITRTYDGVPVHVPFFGIADCAESAVEVVERYRTSKTVALYLNTPNNPTGKVIPRSWLEALVEWARQHGLWLLADEVYEDYCYSDAHTWTRPLAPERTFSVHSFSKAFGMAGNRCGYVVGPEQVMSQVRKVSTHAWYSTPKASQVAGMRALGGMGDEWVADVRPRYEAVARAASARLGLPTPEGSTFLFIDVAEYLDERGLMGFLEDCVERGLFVAPGSSFGPYPTHIRMCFTAAPPEVTLRGVEVLAGRLGR